VSPPGDTSPRCSGLTSFDAVAGVVDRYGAADLTTLTAQALPTAIADSHAPDLREAQLIGAPVAEAPELARAASPVTYVHPGARRSTSPTRHRPLPAHRAKPPD